MKTVMKRVFMLAAAFVMICSLVPLGTSAAGPADIPLNNGATVAIFSTMSDDRVKQVLFEQLVADPKGADWASLQWEIHGKSYSDTIAGEPMSRWNWGDPITGFSWTEKIALTTHAYHVNPLKHLSDGTYEIRLKGSDTAVSMTKTSSTDQHTHTGIPAAGQAPTCAADGWKAYYRCDCGKCFEEADCTTEITDLASWKAGRGKLNHLNHDWAHTKYSWALEPVRCTARRTCLICGTQESAAAVITSEVTSMPTCGAMGTTTYTASFAEDWAPAMVTSFEDVPELPHDWGEALYIWADDGSSCTARHVCKNDAAHTEEAVCTNTESTVTSPASCEASGRTTFTAAFSESWAARQTIQMDLPAALGHDWGETVYTWADDGSTCQAVRTCRRDPAHSEVLQATVTRKVVTEPTCLTDGSTLCTAVFSESWAAQQTKTLAAPAALGHDLTEQPRKEAACTQDGWEQHWKCLRCGQLFSDALGTSSLSSVPLLPATGHSWSQWTEDTAAACTQNGQESRTCSSCKETETRVIPALNHLLTLHPRVEPTCTADGHEAYWKCSRCGLLFRDAQGVSALDAVPSLPATGHSWGQWQTDTAVTCTQDGQESRVCAKCGTPEHRTIPAPGHDWGKAIYSWASDGSTCKAVRTCNRDPNHTEEAWATVTSKVATEPTCTANGSSLHTAVFTADWAETQEKTFTNQEQPLGHSWGPVTYRWAKDGSSCTASRVCKRDPGHTETAQASISRNVTKAAGCETSGKTTFTARFSQSWAASQTMTADLPAATGHRWGQWTTARKATCSEEGLQRRTCLNDSAHVQSRSLPILSHTPGEAWKSDDTGHWHTCKVCDAKLEKTEHSLQWVVDSQAQDGMAGSRHQECTVCHHKLPEEPIPAYSAQGEGSWAQNTDSGLLFTASGPIQEVLVDGMPLSAQDYILDGPNLTLTPEYLQSLRPDSSYTLTMTFEYGSLDTSFGTGPYTVTEGDGSSFLRDETDQGLRFHANGAYQKFRSILVDGNPVDSQNYTVQEGSTVITLVPAYLESLKAGAHTLTVQYSDGACEASFTVQGHTLPLLLIIGLCALGLLALCGITVLIVVLVILKHKKK